MVEALKTEVAALKTDLNQKAVDDLVELAITEGKLLPAQEQWAHDLGNKDLAALKTYIESAEPIAALTGTQTQNKTLDENGEVVLGETDLAVCKQLGISEAEFKKSRQAELKAN